MVRKDRASRGRPGRPAEDPAARRRDIYSAAGPLILERGYRGLTMAAAARAAYVSVGGLYHYFRSKRDLALYAIQLESLARIRHGFEEQHASLHSTDPAGYLQAFIEYSIGQVLFARPSARAAMEIGGTTLWSGIQTGLRADQASFVARGHRSHLSTHAHHGHARSRDLRRRAARGAARVDRPGAVDGGASSPVRRARAEADRSLTA